MSAPRQHLPLTVVSVFLIKRQQFCVLHPCNLSPLCRLLLLGPAPLRPRDTGILRGCPEDDALLKVGRS